MMELSGPNIALSSLSKMRQKRAMCDSRNSSALLGSCLINLGFQKVKTSAWVLKITRNKIAKAKWDWVFTERRYFMEIGRTLKRGTRVKRSLNSNNLRARGFQDEPRVKPPDTRFEKWEKKLSYYGLLVSYTVWYKQTRQFGWKLSLTLYLAQGQWFDPTADIQLDG